MPLPGYRGAVIGRQEATDHETGAYTEAGVLSMDR